MLINEEEKLDIDIILNCILVKENIRPAMLVQPADYKEDLLHVCGRFWMFVCGDFGCLCVCSRICFVKI